jgi:hypothetical protein
MISLADADIRISAPQRVHAAECTGGPAEMQAGDRSR